MKKITLFITLLATALSYAQPSSKPADPTHNAADVISIYGDTYTSVATNLNPNWGQSGVGQANPSYDVGNGDLVLAYPNFNYQGTELTTQNASAMEFLHLDIYTDANPANTTIQVSPINNGTGAVETLVTINYTSGQWTSVDIPKSAFTGMTWDSVFQIKYAANGAGSTVPVDIYLDNVYFYKVPANPTTDATLSDLQIDNTSISGFSSSQNSYTYEVPAGTTVVPQITAATTSNASATTTITQATAIPGNATVMVTAVDGTTTNTYTVSIEIIGPSTGAPTPPARLATDVISVYGDAYGTAIGLSNVTWDGTSVFNEVTIAGEDMLKVDFDSFLGTTLGTVVDATGMTHFHMDYYADAPFQAGQVFNIKWSNHANNSGETNALLYNVEFPGNGTLNKTWNSIDIPITDFTDGTTPRANLTEFLITVAGLIDTGYVDNIYFHKNTVLSTTDIASFTGFKLYPNPTSNLLTISANESISKAEVFNVLGKKVKSFTINSVKKTVDTSDLSSGVYLIKLTSSTAQTTTKFIKR